MPYAIFLLDYVTVLFDTTFCGLLYVLRAIYAIFNFGDVYGIIIIVLGMIGTFY